MTLELRPISICNLDEIVELYRAMILENSRFDPQLLKAPTDSRALRNMLQFSFDIENAIFFMASAYGKAVGFIDSTRFIQEGGDAWYIKGLYLSAPFREPRNYVSMIYRVEKDASEKGVRKMISRAMLPDTNYGQIWEMAGYSPDDGKWLKTLNQ